MEKVFVLFIGWKTKDNGVFTIIGIFLFTFSLAVQLLLLLLKGQHRSTGRNTVQPNK